ncbi:hypothetical protein DIU31_019615 [Mucilaginibacter rubeus]|uniref:Antitoxin n=1 Tax=Mucilaginibacter rubeus TaxID=2027860 RepID=A0AAE6MJF1_9SPHI|nr:MULTISPECIES: DUF6364 family protein [Mucilaginibacter]QEM05613.1 hypothetical protein DIU31_019615 [Mucilaginibacter rubeus]QEM18200.1 hypothetical protein DIU38_019815 [Mucilaginibacter gossypii]QTE45266.1 hypothetical protein J3L19_07890 [Mucilaginibacter rubeus]QTE51862.1 hypothetical protein J3L21_07865 [Mucilaginibacter rubeus]QTE56950.1 hypothetical protein J3L23_33100 [Mucilaginibacter rubeus]
MESTKLTLSVKADSLSLVKEYAKRQHTSVSKLVQEFLDGIAEQEKKDDPIKEKYKNVEIPEWITQLTGIVKDPNPDMSYDDMKQEYFKEKYGL